MDNRNDRYREHYIRIKEREMRRQREKKRKMYFRRRLFLGITFFLVLFLVYFFAKKIIVKSKENPGNNTNQNINNNNDNNNNNNNNNNDEKESEYSTKLKNFAKAKNKLDVFEKNNDKSKKLTEIPAGEYVQLYGSKDGFSKIKFNGISGFVKTDDIEENRDENLFKIKDGILIVNKHYGLPSDYNPGVNQEALEAYKAMKEAAKREGLSIKIGSDFRSYEQQEKIYKNSVKAYGPEETNKISSKAGHSEHQTGLAFDFMNFDQSTRINERFDNTKEAKWLKENAYKYGFILRYPKGKENITQYKFESWHYRYLGVEDAAKVHNSGMTLEEYLGLDKKVSKKNNN